MDNLPEQESDLVEINPSQEDASETEQSFTPLKPDELPEELRPTHKSLQADYTRKTQELASLRKEAEQALEFQRALSDDESRAEALRHLSEQYGEKAVLEALGYQFDDEEDTPEPTFEDPRVTQLEQKLQAIEEEKIVERIESQVEKFYEGKELSEKEQGWVLNHALSNYPPNTDGSPQLDKALEDFEELIGERVERVKPSRKSRTPLTGGAGTEKVDMNDTDTRRRVMADMLAAESQ